MVWGFFLVDLTTDAKLARLDPRLRCKVQHQHRSRWFELLVLKSNMKMHRGRHVRDHWPAIIQFAEDHLGKNKHIATRKHGTAPRLIKLPALDGHAHRRRARSA
jgi:hypothetical protein